MSDRTWHVTIYAFGKVLSQRVTAPTRYAAEQHQLDKIGFRVESVEVVAPGQTALADAQPSGEYNPATGELRMYPE